MRQKVSLFWRGCHLRDGKDADVFSSRVSLSLVDGSCSWRSAKTPAGEQGLSGHLRLATATGSCSSNPDSQGPEKTCIQRRTTHTSG